MATIIIALACTIVLVIIGLVIYFSVLDAKDEADDIKKFDNRKDIHKG